MELRNFCTWRYENWYASYLFTIKKDLYQHGYNKFLWGGLIGWTYNSFNIIIEYSHVYEDTEKKQTGVQEILSYRNSNTILLINGYPIKKM